MAGVFRLLSDTISAQGLAIEPGIWAGVWGAALVFLGSVMALSLWRIHASLVALAR
jgi:hypothetical protein